MTCRKNWLGLSSGEPPPLCRQLSNRAGAVVTVLRVNEDFMVAETRWGLFDFVPYPRGEKVQAPKVVAPPGYRLVPVHSVWLARDPNR